MCDMCEFFKYNIYWSINQIEVINLSSTLLTYHEIVNRLINFNFTIEKQKTNTLLNLINLFNNFLFCIKKKNNFLLYQRVCF